MLLEIKIFKFSIYTVYYIFMLFASDLFAPTLSFQFQQEVVFFPCFIICCCLQLPLWSQIWLHFSPVVSDLITLENAHRCKQIRMYSKQTWHSAHNTLQKIGQNAVNKYIYGIFSNTFFRILQFTTENVFFWISSLPPCRLTVPRQWASALVKGLQSGDTRQTSLVFRQSRQALQVCPVWHLKHLRSLLCRGRSDGPDRLSLLGASGPLSNLPGSVRGWDTVEELLARNTNYHGCLAFSSSPVFSTR